MKPEDSKDCRHESSGFALVLVLGILTLLIILAVGFISSTGTERAAASGFLSSVSTRQLADTTVGLVQGQINLATTQGATVAWASQPGMVRTFDNSNGSLLKAYKLYSAANMIVGTVDLKDDYPTDTWADDTAIWTDLNAPVEVNGVNTSGTSYPILDPSSLALPTAQQPEGFSITSAPGVTGTSYQKAPMPVRWLYVLRDGEVVAPTETSGKTATIPGATNAKGANPIIGRIAFWTDDETCKVNINTASEGTYWDTPRANSIASSVASTGDEYEAGYAQYQPAQKEFQRYPGHPATTSLSPIFPALTKNQIYDLVPRVTGGGSDAGTAIASGTIPLDSDRLYANVDELVFKPNRDANAAGLTKTQLEQAKFFLTAHSRAPETNLFNLPRIAMWPIYKLGSTGTPDGTHTTAFDRLIAFCASTGTFGSTYHPYIFQRENAYSATNDISLDRNVEILSYLTYLTGQNIPGFGGRFSDKYPMDRDQILTEVFDYIRSVNLQDSTLAASANGYTKPMTASGTATLVGAQSGYGWVVPSQRGSGSAKTMGFGRYYTLSELSLVFICNAVANASGTTNESCGSNIASGAGANTVLSGTALNPGQKYIQAMILPEFFSPMQGFIAMFPDMQMTISGLETLEINGQNLFPAITGSATFTNPGGVWETIPTGGCPTYRFFGFGKGSPARGNLAGDSGTLYPFIGTPIKINAPATGGTMTFTGGQITVNLYAGTPSSLIQTIPITFPNSIALSSSNTMESSTSFPVPDIVPEGVKGTYGSTAFGDTKENWWAYSRTGAVSGKTGRLWWISNRVFCGSSGYGPGTFLRPEYDTVRAMLPAHGDYRLIAASPSVRADAFANHPDYYHPTQHIASCLSGANSSYRAVTLPGNDVGGKYISTVTYDTDSVPNIPTGATQTPQVTGDFDNGLASSVDGAYVNKPDEGDASTTPSMTDYSTFPYYRVFVGQNAFTSVGTTFFSPNRQIPSSGMLGSLSTGVKANVPWKTLLFRPQKSHPSYSTTIPDHLLMDLFWMPVVEPYAISDRFSTAGKINMNYQILPFTYIERSSGMRAVLKAERLAAIPISQGSSYKGTGHKNDSKTYTSYRLSIDRKTTLTQFQNKFTNGQIFKSASEICDIHIVPEGKTVADMEGSFWTDHALTGDNLRERIYTTLYPRLTTKSNTFTVHCRVQTLKQIPSTAAGTWTEGKDAILGEYRGSTSLERFIDANNSSIPDYAANPSSISSLDPLDKFYRWRVVENRQFAP